MHFQPQRSLHARQHQFESRLKNPYFHALRQEFAELVAPSEPLPPPSTNIKLRTCQFIESEPTKRQLREFGGDHFKCGAASVEGKPYCTEHCVRCYKQVLTTDDK